MRPTTPAFLPAVSSSHAMASRATVCLTGQTGTTPTGTRIPLEAGSVTFDSTRQCQATIDLTTSQNYPASVNDLLAPYGVNEIFIERGVVYGGGSVEWVSLGYYRIDQPEQQNAPKGAVTITGSDRMQQVIEQKIVSPITFGAGSTVAFVINYLVSQVYGWVTIDMDPSLSTATLAADQVTTEDRYGFLNDLITSYGMIWYWDYRGHLVVKPPPNPVNPVTTITSGAGGTLVTLSRSLSRIGTYNACMATGQQGNDNTSPYALVVNNDPTSPTYWPGPFGKIPYFMQSSFLANSAQCATAASAWMLANTGVIYEVDFGMVPNPALELYDPITVNYPGSQEKHVIKQMVIGLSAKDTMTAQTRQLVGGVFAQIL